MKYDSSNIPRLPHGEGTISVYSDTLLIYKKSIKLNNGKTVRKSVYGESPKECMKKMRELENELHKSIPTADKEPLSNAMYTWLQTIKRKTLKDAAYDRLESTIRNQIENSEIGHLRYQYISTNDINNLITTLINKNYSHSVIKKTYDALNEFYRYKSAMDKFDNPMTLVTMPTKNNVVAETRDIEFFEQSDIDKFIEECEARYNTGNLKYRYGYAIAANIYLGMRMGELLAIQWKDIDFDNNTIYVSKTLIERVNRQYDKSQPELMRQKGIKKVEFYVQHSTKKSKNRYVPINSKAKELLIQHFENSEFIDSDDYVLSTRNRKTTTIKNVSDTIRAIEQASETSVQSAGTHILRHTCASLYFRKGVNIETICAILGNTREVCEKTYIHFIDEQLKVAASKIDAIEV